MVWPVAFDGVRSACASTEENKMRGFCTFIAALVVLVAASGCSKPADAVIPTDPVLWGTQLAPSIEKMNPEERQLLKDYLARVTAGRILRGGKGVPPGTTIGAALEDQRDVSARLEKVTTEAKVSADARNWVQGDPLARRREAAPARPAENWSALAGTQSSTLNAAEVTTAEIDASSIREHDGYRQAWWRQNFVPPRPDAASSEGVGTIFHLSLFDCKNAKSAFFIKASYTASADQQALLYNESRTKAEVFDRLKSVVPGSYVESALRFACTHPLQ